MSRLSKLSLCHALTGGGCGSPTTLAVRLCLPPWRFSSLHNLEMVVGCIFFVSFSSMVILNLLENAERGKGATRGGPSLRMGSANLRSEAGLPSLGELPPCSGWCCLRGLVYTIPLAVRLPLELDTAVAYLLFYSDVLSLHLCAPPLSYLCSPPLCGATAVQARLRSPEVDGLRENPHQICPFLPARPRCVCFVVWHVHRFVIFG